MPMRRTFEAVRLSTRKAASEEALQTMNVLISDSVSLNGGDEALLRATVETLLARWPGIGVTVLCNNVGRVPIAVKGGGTFSNPKAVPRRLPR